MREDGVRSNKRHRKFFMYHDKELWSSDSEDDDYVLSADVKKPIRTRTKRNKLSEDTSPSECDKLKEYDDLWGQRMPVEILCKIFQHVIGWEGKFSSLDLISKVCRLWHDVSLIPSLWLTVNFNKEKAAVNFFRSQMPNLMSVTISCVLKPSTWKLIADNCPKLRSIDLSTTSISGPTLLSIAQQCPFLNSVRLSDVASNATSSGALIKLFEVMNVRLKSFSISNCSVSFAKPLRVALTKCPNMELFELNVIASSSIISLNIGDLQKHWRKLRVLRFINVSMKCTAVDDCSLGFPELRELSLNNFTNKGCRNNDIVCNLIRASHKLNYLDLGKLSNLTTLNSAQLPACELEYLCLDKITGCHQLICSMLTKWKNSLVELHLSDISCPEVEFKKYLETFVRLKPLPSLRELFICGMPVTPSDVLRIIDACPQLVKLDLTLCRELPRGTKKMHCDRQSIINLISTLKEVLSRND